MKSRLPQEYIDKYRPKQANRVPQMTLYDLNKQMVKQIPPIDDKGKKHFEETIFNQFNSSDNHYYMLLCKELSYFTVFHKDENNTEEFLKTVFDLLKERGTLITAGWDNEEQKNGLEFWMRVKTPIENNPDYEDIYCFYLFKYDSGVLEVK